MLCLETQMHPSPTLRHLDRKLDIPSLVGMEVNIRPKKVKEERNFGDRNNGRNSDRRGK
jgi:hypothetical protein